MEIDHFDPSIQGGARHDYKNLFLATRHCNGSKSNTWPTRSMRKKGIRLLNPCQELDYGHHVFEHPITHRLIGVTPAGEYHIISCDLNARHLVQERKDRAQIWALIEQTPMTIKSTATSFPSNELILLREQVEKMIPRIAYLPKDHPAYNEELLLVQAISVSP